MQSVRRKRLLIATVILVGVSGVVTWIKVPRLRYREEIHACEELIGKIEALRQAQGQLPDASLFPETEERLFYKPEKDGYVVGFILGFDEYESFDSRTHRWSFDGPR